jgi:hypothetical protein
MTIWQVSSGVDFFTRFPWPTTPSAGSAATFAPNALTRSSNRSTPNTKNGIGISRSGRLKSIGSTHRVPDGAPPAPRGRHPLRRGPTPEGARCPGGVLFPSSKWRLSVEGRGSDHVRHGVIAGVPDLIETAGHLGSSSRPIRVACRRAGRHEAGHERSRRHYRHGLGPRRGRSGTAISAARRFSTTAIPRRRLRESDISHPVQENGCTYEEHHQSKGGEI